MWQVDFTLKKLKYVTIIFYSVKDSSMLQLDFTPWKAQLCNNLILLRERLKYVTIRFYYVKGSSMSQLIVTQWKTQTCDN
jgi:hypothetical protein